jgi:anti-sigma factor RsiW
MQQCHRYRKEIGLLALGALSAEESAHLRQHIEECPPCRERWEDLSAVCDRLSADASSLPTAESSQFFHERLRRNVLATPQRMSFHGLLQLIGKLPARWLRPGQIPRLSGDEFSSWKVGFSMAAGCVLAIILFYAGWRHEGAKAPLATAAAVSKEIPDPKPTLGRYQMLANKSLDEFDELMNRDAARILPSKDGNVLRLVDSFPLANPRAGASRQAPSTD